MGSTEAERIQKRFGASVRQIRQEKGLSQEKLALEAGLDRTYIVSVESGRRNVSLVNIVRIASALKVTVQELFD